MLFRSLKLYVAPTLNSVKQELFYGIAGTIEIDKDSYCFGQKSEPINHLMSITNLNAWDKKSFGAVKYGNDLKTYWQIADGINSDVKYEVADDSEYNYSEMSNYMSKYVLGSVDKGYSVMFTIDDGCTSLSTERVRVKMVSSKIDESRITSTQGVEEGETLTVKYYQSLDNWYWFGDEECTDTLLVGDFIVNVDDVSRDSKVYLQLVNETYNCKGEPYEVPLMIVGEAAKQ